MVKVLRDIGYYDCLELNGKSFHVQTEVMGKDEVKIKTSVISDGAILDGLVSICPSSVTNLEQGEAVAKTQHKDFLNRVQNHEYK